MADKQINTRISLKYDTLENWKNSTVEGQGGRLVLLAGEIGIATITQPNITDKELPPVMFKVGDGKTEFRNLNWTSALAADVYGWAKEAGIKIAYVDSTGNVETTPSGVYVTGIAWDSTNSRINVTTGNITINKVGSGNFVKNVAWNNTNKGIDVTLGDIGEGDLPAFDYVMSVTSEDVATTRENGTITLTVDTSEGSGGTIYPKVKGFNELMPKTGGTFTGNVVFDGLVGTNKAVTIGGSQPLTVQTDAVFQVGVSIVSAPQNDNDAANKKYVDGAIANSIKDITSFEYQVVSQLPETGKKGVIYLVPHEHGTQDGYDEYIWIANESGGGSFEKIGSTDMDLSGYVTTNTVQTITSRKVFQTNDTNGAIGISSNNGTSTAYLFSSPTGGTTNITLPPKTGTLALTSDIPASVNSFGGIYVQDGDRISATMPNDGLGFEAPDGSGITLSGVAQSEITGGVAVIIEHSVPTGAAAKISGLYKIATDKFGHVTGTTAVTKADITALGVVSANNAALKDRDGNAIFTANASEDVTITVINCGSSTEVI